MKMKKLLTLGVLVCTLFACQMDEEVVVKPNSFRYDNKDYSLASVIVENYGKNKDGNYELFVSLISSGIMVKDINGEFLKVSGKGNLISLNVMSKTTTLENGVYSLKNTMKEAGTLEYGSLYVDYNFDTFSGKLLDIQSGNIIVKKNNNLYELTIALVADDDNPVDGYIKANIKQYEYK